MDDPTTPTAGTSHQLYGGYYIISKIRHYINKDEYMMDVELIKNSFAQRLGGQKTETSTGQ